MSRKPDDDPVSDEPIWARLGDYWGSLDHWLQTFILVATATGFLVAFLKWIRPRIANFFADLRAIRDTLVGRPAMRDSITQRLIPGTAQPSIGERMASQEQLVASMAESIAVLVKNSDRLTNLEAEVREIKTVLNVDKRLDKIESVQLLRTIETVAQAEPTEPPEGDRPD